MRRISNMERIDNMADVIREREVPEKETVVVKERDVNAREPRSNTGVIIAVILVVLLLLFLLVGNPFGGGGTGTGGGAGGGVQAPTPGGQ